MFERKTLDDVNFKEALEMDQRFKIHVVQAWRPGLDPGTPVKETTDPTKVVL